MVSKKSIHYGRFDGFQSPLVPKAPRSLRVNSNRKSLEGSAFELLVDVADKLLQESESSTSFFGQEHKEKITLPTVNVKREEFEVKVKPLKEPSESDNDSGLEHVSDVKTCDFLKKIRNNVKLEPFEGENLDKLGKNAPSHGDIYDYNLVNSIPEIKTVVVEKQGGEMTFRDLCVDTCVLNKSYSSVNQPFYKDPISCFTKHRGNVKTGTTDDDDNSYRRNYCGTKLSAFRSRSRVGYRRIRKMLTSRYRKVTTMKDYKLSDPTSDGMKPFYQNRKNIDKREMRQIEAASKRRKLFHQNSSKATYVQEASNKVKFSIKSFKVPELYIEMPETATIGSLKGTVMEAVRAILGGELDVGILVEGKKVKENDQTLQQTGISRNCDLKTLGFTLEPRFQKEPTLSLPHDTSQQPSSCTSSPITDVGYSNCSRDHPPATSLDNYVDKNREIVSLLTEVLTVERVTDSKPLVPIISVDQNLIKKSDVSQRRIRRPFSVSEVEALVEAVEKLGTGRWRDIKLRAFDDANHRTYVDLKDKWKTLVHTASIAPQQRRGEAVPQNLLDRVLTSHRYWSNNQLKQQRKHCTETAFEN